MLAFCLFALTAAAGVLARGPLALEPAFTLRVGVKLPIPVGPVIAGYGISWTPCPNGTIISAPGADTQFHATILDAYDLIHIDPDETKLRLSVNGVARTTDGITFHFAYTGIGYPDDTFNAILNRDPGTESDVFGKIMSHHRFEIPVTAPHLAGLNNNQFVGTGRLVVNPDRTVVVEYLVDRVYYMY